MLIERGSFERLCRSRELLCRDGIEPPSVHDVARAVGFAVVPLGCFGLMGLLPRTAFRNSGEA